MARRPRALARRAFALGQLARWMAAHAKREGAARSRDGRACQDEGPMAHWESEASTCGHELRNCIRGLRGRRGEGGDHGRERREGGRVARDRGIVLRAVAHVPRDCRAERRDRVRSVRGHGLELRRQRRARWSLVIEFRTWQIRARACFWSRTSRIRRARLIHCNCATTVASMAAEARANVGKLFAAVVRAHRVPRAAR